MNKDNAPFDDLREQLAQVIERLDSLGADYASARASLHAMDGGLGRYADIFYPMPYKRPDNEVLDMARAAIQAINDLTEKLK